MTEIDQLRDEIFHMRENIACERATVVKLRSDLALRHQTALDRTEIIRGLEAEIERLTRAMSWYTSGIAERDAEIERLRATIRCCIVAMRSAQVAADRTDWSPMIDGLEKTVATPEQGENERCDIPETCNWPRCDCGQS